MKIKLLFLLSIWVIQGTCSSINAQINHWETVINFNQLWRYQIGTAEPDTNWRKLSFNDNAWSQGNGGIGLGDGDDNTTIALSTSFYYRRNFFIVDTAAILMAMMSIDYDDGFIAYINNVEVARNNMGAAIGDLPAYNNYANSQHEAQMYQGGGPENFTINKTLLRSCLLPGNNVLAVTVHNATAGSADLSSLTWLHLGIADNTNNYSPTPPWFVEPFSSSNIPIVVVNTGGQNIVDDPRIFADMGIIYNGPGVRNYIGDPYNNYNGKVGIEIRGSSSQMFPKKCYGFETEDSLGMNNNVSLLGLPVENDWVLYAPYTEKAMMKDALIFELYHRMGHYATRYKYCELVINGDYRGVYILEEKIKFDKNRVDMKAVDQNDLAGDSLTGGYIFKVDKFTGTNNPGWASTFNGNVLFQYHDPDEAFLMVPQKNYLSNYVNQFETALNGPGFTNPVTGYRKYIDVESFVDFLIVNEVSRNVDGYRLSSYFSKQRDSYGGKIYALPLWDFNLAFGNGDYCDGWRTNGWSYNFNNVCPNDGYEVPFWWPRLVTDPYFNEVLGCRWNQYRSAFLDNDSIFAWMDSISTMLQESQARNYVRWPILGTYVWPNAYVCNTYQEEVDTMKWWITQRMNWLDANFPNPATPCTTGSPKVVISEINYHSNPASNAGDWIEIWNSDDISHDLSHYILKDDNNLHAYYFPQGTILPADGRMVISTDTILFRNVHPNATPLLGQFSWTLDDGGEIVRLYDNNYSQFKNVTYDDLSPWPMQADGYGYTLELNDPAGNLNDGNNWFFGCPDGSPTTPFVANCWIASAQSPSEGMYASVYPNPFTNEFTLKFDGRTGMGNENISISITDVTGKIIQRREISTLVPTAIKMDEYPAGIYFLAFENKGERIAGVKIIKTN